jgi:molecular chaperone HtpG
VKHGLRLYVKRVLIMEQCEELLPRWLRFVRGVVDSEDLPLNVSRELLQDSTIVRTIRKQIVKQLLDLLDELSKDEGKYGEAWKSYGNVLKEGLHFEPDQKARLAPLLRYESSRGEGLTSLAAYKERMPEGQKAIYYVLAESRMLAERSPHTEALKKRSYEVLYMTDPVDSFAVEGLPEYDGLPLVSVTGTDLKLPDAGDGEKPKEPSGELKDLSEHIRRKLQDFVSEVRVSTRLTDSPACLVVPEDGLQPNIERYLRATRKDLPRTKRIMEVNPDHPLVKNLERLLQPNIERYLRATRKDLPRTKRIMEVNPDHPLVKNLERLHARDPESQKLGDFIELLFEQALLAEGSPIEDPTRFATRLTALLQEASGSAVA